MTTDSTTSASTISDTTAHPATHRAPGSSDTPASAALLARARAVTPGGVNSPVRAFRAVGGTPRFMASGKDFGKNLHWDVHGPWIVDSVDLQPWQDYWLQDDALFRSEMGNPGAQPADLVLQALEQAWAERSPLTLVSAGDGPGCEGDSCAV